MNDTFRPRMLHVLDIVCGLAKHEVVGIKSGWLHDYVRWFYGSWSTLCEAFRYVRIDRNNPIHIDAVKEASLTNFCLLLHFTHTFPLGCPIADTQLGAAGHRSGLIPYGVGKKR